MLTEQEKQQIRTKAETSMKNRSIDISTLSQISPPCKTIAADGYTISGILQAVNLDATLNFYDEAKEIVVYNALNRLSTYKRRT